MAARERWRVAMTSETLWALGRGCGTTALGFLTLSLALGIITRSGRRLPTLPRFAVAEVHRFAALAGTLLVALHVGLLFADPYAQLYLIDFVVPLLGHYRPLWQGLGTLACDLLIVVVVSSMFRLRLGVRAFRVVHWTSYALWPIALAHAFGNGTDTGHVWFLIFAGCCVVVAGGALVWRLRTEFAEYARARNSVGA
ncbi:sulfoxide reductase heme-binding subunit YedZ [Mycolicibacterium sp. BK634]|uniref:ferric reductase-like transmembrane domain-containing protein n=1 Tax=Mycobacteriaceae TaxID=1762 RepID=UPI0017F8001E|nr:MULTISPECIES: ferric reductase-like transmembrane domain-containing protein [Mycobacteriaceae]MBB3752375.1 sulfoxide reductase heme-binding subunit YedZ [Mycolicibacterium sp. BK634]